MEDTKREEVKAIHPDDIRRTFKFPLEAGIAKRFIKACDVQDVYVRETIRDFMVTFADKVLGKVEK